MVNKKDSKKSRKKISAIVPAYNEEQRIGKVLDVLSAYPHFHEIIVVDDGSTDRTREIVKNYSVKYLRNSINRGKGYCMERAAMVAEGEILFFSDADIVGLNETIIDELIRPVTHGDLDMMVGMIDRKVYFLKFILAFIPLLGGERALTKELWWKIPRAFKKKFRIEAALNFYARYYGGGYGYKIFSSLSQTVKEKKYGFWKGLRHRLGMWKDIIAAQARLELLDVPTTIKNKRFIVFNIIADSVGIAFGSLLIIASQVGPAKFLLSLFRRKLIEDPDTPLVYLLLNIATLVGTTFLLYAGVILCILNLFFFVVSLSRFFGLKKNALRRVEVKNL